jgi:hypothetical protein
MLGLNRVRPLLLLLAAGAGVAGCESGNQPPQPYSTSFWASGWTFHLRHLKSDVPADGDRVKEVWRDLFVGMARDAKTRDLLRQLHAGLPVELVVLDAKQAEDKAVMKAPPPDGTAVAMRVADVTQIEEKSKAGAVPVRVIAYSRVILMKDSAAPGNLGALAQDLRDEPSPGGPLSLAVEDYIQRHAPGWAVIGGPFFEGEKLPAGVEEQRRDLDRRIRVYEDQAKAFFGVRRQR